MRCTSIALFAAGLLLTAAAATHAEEDPIEAALANPRATGLLVTAVVPDTPAQDESLAPGDVLLTYDGRGVTDLAGLAAGKEAAGGKETVVCTVLRAGGERVQISLPPGPLGVQLVPIAEGAPAAPLPADTGEVLDPSLADGRDEWFDFTMGGKKVGMEHLRVRVEGAFVRFTHEVAFDGGKEWGLHHAIVRASLRCGTTAQPVSFSYENALTGWASRSRVIRDAQGRSAWRALAGKPDGETVTTEIPLRGGLSSVPSYAVAQIARLLPQRKGACCRFQPVADWDGAPGLHAAIVCVGQETVTVGGTAHVTWKYEQRQLGGSVTGTYWFDAERRLVRADYGGPVATMATKEQALEGLSATLRPRTAD